MTLIMKEDFYFRGQLRNEAFEKLKVFIANPGKFSLIVVGKRGTGKKHAIKEVFQHFKKSKKYLEDKNSLTEVVFIKANEIAIPKDLINTFKENSNKTVVFEDIEEMEDDMQDLLFKALETTDGKLGLETKVNIRILFTSSVDIESLRTEQTNLKGRLWERISQLIVEFPSFSEENTFIVKDYRNTWKKMSFEKIEEYKHFSNYPNNIKLQVFLEQNAAKMEGGFRDLDKIAILYFNYRILLYEENKKIDEKKENEIVDRIKKDFLGKIQLKKDDTNFSLYEINWNLKGSEILKDFKKQIRILWKKGNPNKTFSQLEEKLGLGKGTTKNWK